MALPGGVLAATYKAADYATTWRPRINATWSLALALALALVKVRIGTAYVGVYTTSCAATVQAEHFVRPAFPTLNLDWP